MEIFRRQALNEIFGRIKEEVQVQLKMSNKEDSIINKNRQKYSEQTLKLF
jgi:hypothetical protein